MQGSGLLGLQGRMGPPFDEIASRLNFRPTAVQRYNKWSANVRKWQIPTRQPQRTKCTIFQTL